MLLGLLVSSAKVGGFLHLVNTSEAPPEIWPKMMKIRKEHAAKIEALLTDAKKKQWKEMIGKPFALDD